MTISANPGVVTNNWLLKCSVCSQPRITANRGRVVQTRAEDAEELFVTLTTVEVRIVFVYCRNEYELDRSNDHAIVLHTC